MTTLRRFAVMLALMFWQGGFTFYTGVVVPIGTDILGSPEEQGWITRRVTDYLNLAGVVAVVVLGWDIAAGGDPGTGRRRLRWLVWALLAAMLGMLAWLHGRLDAYLDVEQLRILDRPTFRALHRGYLWVSTAQWTCGLVAVYLLLRAWRAEDDTQREKS
jgi:hypothetical protein